MSKPKRKITVKLPDGKRKEITVHVDVSSLSVSSQVAVASRKDITEEMSFALIEQGYMDVLQALAYHTKHKKVINKLKDMLMEKISSKNISRELEDFHRKRNLYANLTFEKAVVAFRNQFFQFRNVAKEFIKNEYVNEEDIKELLNRAFQVDVVLKEDHDITSGIHADIVLAEIVKRRSVSEKFLREVLDMHDLHEATMGS